MTRKYINDRWCVRCGKDEATPYLRKNWELLADDSGSFGSVIDVGCGNGRNSAFMTKKLGAVCTMVDMAGDVGSAVTLGVDKLPVEDKSVDIVLANYIFMFLSATERRQVVKEIKRIAKDNCKIMVELYPAKDSHAPTDKDVEAMRDGLFKQLGWNKVRLSKARFIAKK